MKVKRIYFGYSKRRDSPQVLKIEMPGGCVTITTGLTETRTGRDRIRIDVEANGTRFSGEDPWWYIFGDRGCHGDVGWFERDPKAV